MQRTLVKAELSAHHACQVSFTSVVAHIRGESEEKYPHKDNAIKATAFIKLAVCAFILYKFI